MQLSSASPGVRVVNYSEVSGSNANRSGYTLRNNQYKLTQFDSNRQRFYDLFADPYEQDDLLTGSLTTAESEALAELVAAGNTIRQ